MTTRTFALDFYQQGPTLFPVNPELHKMAVEFAKKNLNSPINLTKLTKVWVAARCDAGGKPVEITGLAGTVLKPDIPLFKTTEGPAAKELIDRINNYYADQGCTGVEAFVYIADNEPEATRCPRYMEWLKAIGAKPAERWSVICK